MCSQLDGFNRLSALRPETSLGLGRQGVKAATAPAGRACRVVGLTVLPLPSLPGNHR